jgi:hypothetical protein
MSRYLMAAVCSLVIFSSCHLIEGRRVHGNGNVRKEDRTANRRFTAVDVSNAFELHLRQDSAFSVNIETDENLLQYIIITNEGDKLRIYSERNINLEPTNGHKVKIYVSAPLFKDIEASGACTVIGDNPFSSGSAIAIDLSGATDASLELKSPKVSVELSGASGVNLKGETKDLSLEATGASHAECFDLLSENTEVDVSGASKAEVFGSVNINATASGASDVKYKGKGNVIKNESGASSVQKAD